VLRVLGLGKDRDVDSVEALERDLGASGAPKRATLDAAKRARLAELQSLAEEALATRPAPRSGGR
jgi:hypothetical protein